MGKYQDDVFDKLESDISRIRLRHRQYISYSNEQGAKSVVDEILANALDECRTPRSPGNTIHIIMDDRDGFITISDNGRGIPTNIMEDVYTTLNMGSNIFTSKKASLKAETLGQNGTGTLAICGLAEKVEITSYRGGTENIYKTLVFEEGVKVDEKTDKCSSDKHGMVIRYKPSKVMGKNTKIVWEDIHQELLNLQFLNKKAIKISSEHYDGKGNLTQEKYKAQSFENILDRNEKEKMTSNKYLITINADNVDEELDGTTVKRFISMDVAFVYTSLLSPYIDSFSNSNNTVDNGDHLDAAIEGLCRFLQSSTKNMMSEKEREKLDVKWDDVKTGLSIAVSLRSNFERLYTGQTKHKVVSSDIKKIIASLLSEELPRYFSKNPSQLKELCTIVKMNAKVRREGEKVRTAVVKNTLTNWSSYKMKNYDPCTNKGKEYKELFIVEGDSAKGSLKQARNPVFQALFAIRGVSLNVFKVDIDQIIGPKGNKEFTDIVTVMGCNVGPKFDLNKLQFNKIILATDADVDALFIRSLLIAFFFKLFPEIIADGRLYIAEPPLYRVADKKNPFVVNKADYIQRYVKMAMKDYKIGYKNEDGIVSYMNKDQCAEFLSETSSYVDKVYLVRDHYKINDRLIESIIEEFAFYVNYSNEEEAVNNINTQHMIDRISVEFPEIYYDYDTGLIKGVIDGKYQLFKIQEEFVKKCKAIIGIMREWGGKGSSNIVLKDIKSNNEHYYSLLNTLKILKKYQPEIEHRFKGLKLDLNI